MKRLGTLATVITLLAVLLMPGMGDGVELTQPWNESTVSAGAEISDSGSVQHKTRFIDTFDDSSVDALWTQLTSGSGAITEGGAGVLMNSPSNADVAALVWGSRPINKTEENYYKTKFKYHDNTAGRTQAFIDVIEFIGVPSVSATVNVMIQSFVQPTDAINMNYRDDSGATNRRWTDAAEKIWTTSANDISFSPSVDTEYTAIFKHDDRSWSMMVLSSDESTIHAVCSGVWDAVRDSGGNYEVWATFGDLITAAWTSNWTMTYADMPILINTSAQTAESDPYSFTEEFVSTDVTFKLGRTPAGATEIKGYIKEDAGAFSSAININVTPIAGETGWFALADDSVTYQGTTTITIKGEMNAPDADTQLEIIDIKIKGVTISGGGGQETPMGGMQL